MAGPALVALTMTVRHTSAKTIRELWKKTTTTRRFTCAQYWKEHSRPQPGTHREVSTEGGEGGVPRLSQIHASLVKLKRESGVKRQKGNSRLSHGHIPRANSAFPKGDFLDEAAWLFIELCSW